MHFTNDKRDLNESAGVSEAVDGVLDSGLGSELGWGWGKFVARDSF